MCGRALLRNALLLFPPSRFHIVTPLAQRLPVVRAPEQRQVAPVWLDMVDHSSGLDAALLVTSLAERVFAQEGRASFFPAVRVAPLMAATAAVVLPLLARAG